jgi:hypothetical protein
MAVADDEHLWVSSVAPVLRGLMGWRPEGAHARIARLTTVFDHPYLANLATKGQVHATE